MNRRSARNRHRCFDGIIAEILKPTALAEPVDWSKVEPQVLTEQMVEEFFQSSFRGYPPVGYAPPEQKMNIAAGLRYDKNRSYQAKLKT